MSTLVDAQGHWHMLDFARSRIPREPDYRFHLELEQLRFNHEVERRVKIRTFELEKANRLLVEQNSNLKSLVRKDGLTGLYNHTAMLEMIRENIEVNLRYRHPLSLIILDIDHFKVVNDTYGHVFGDHVIKRVAGFIKSSIRNVDSAGRFGGEEFVILLPNTGRGGAVVTAEKIRKGIASLNWEEKSCSITVSAGVARYLEGSAESFVGIADKSLYTAKEMGRNRVASLPYFQMPLPLVQVNG